MAELDTAPVVESAEAELPLSAFVKRGNARDAGHDVPELETADTVVEPVVEVVEEIAEPTEPKIAASTGKPDKRTREGRLDTIQQQINAETARKHTAKSEADAEETRLAGLRAESARLAQRPAQVAQPSPPVVAQVPQQQAQADYKRFMAMPGAPKMADFSGETAYEEWQFAVGAFVADRRYAELRQRDQHAQQVTQQQTKFTTRIQAEVAKDATFQQKLDSTPVDTRIIPYLHGHPQGDEIMVHLVNHPETAQEIAALLNPIDQIGRIGEIVGTLKARADAVTRGPARTSSMSNAKPPIKPLGSSPAVTDDDDGSSDENLPLSAFVKKGNAHDPRINPRLVARR